MKLWTKIILLTIIAVIFLPLAGFGFFAEDLPDAAEHRLFLTTGPAIQSDETDAPQGVYAAMSSQSKKVTINDIFMTPGMVAAGDRVLIDIYSGLSYTAVIDRVNMDINGILSLRGRLENDEYGYIIISGSGNKLTATIKSYDTQQEYLISYDASSEQHYLYEIDPQKADILPGTTPAVNSGEITLAEFAPQSLPEVTEDVVIDVMIVYTPAARAEAAKTTGINTFIAQAMELSQLALDNSDTGVILRLVHSDEVSYVESGSITTDLDLLRRTNDGYMDEVHTWRNKYGADLVNLFTLEHKSGGHAYILGSTNGDPARGFSITRVQQAFWTYTMIHEMAHNMGCHHSKYQTVEKGPGIFSYSAGWRWTGSDQEQYASVMAYSEKIYTIVPYFSNPDILYKDAPTGDSLHGDNARTLRQTKSVIADYRNTELLDSPKLNEALTENTLIDNIKIVFNDNNNWRDNITSLYIDDALINKDKYLLEEGLITLDKNLFHDRGRYLLRLESEGYITAWVFQNVDGATDILKFNIENSTKPISLNYNNRTVNIEVPYKTDLVSLVAEFELADGAKAYVNGKEQVSNNTENDFSQPLSYTIIAKDQSSDEWLVTVSEAPSNEKEILSFSFNEELTSASIDPDEKSITISVYSDTDLTDLAAFFEISKGASAKVGGVVQESGLTKNDFTEPVTYTIYAEDGSNNDWVVKVETSLPVNSVLLDKNEIEINKVETIELIPTIEPVEATDKSLVWTSSNEIVATVEAIVLIDPETGDERMVGKVTPHNPGTTDITVRAENGDAEFVCVVDVFFGYGILRGTVVDVGDAILILRSIVGLVTLDRVQLRAANLSGSDDYNEADIVDAILILRKIVGLIEEFPVEETEEVHL